jgi:hypothetical protein
MKKIIASLMGIGLLSGALFAPPLNTESAPAIIAIVATVTTVTTAVLVYDYNSCDLHVIWGCDDNGGGGGNGSGSGGGGGGTGGAGAGGAGSGNGAGSGGGGLGGQFCTSTENSCGISSNGTTDSQGICQAVPPPLSSCPTPTFEQDFEAEPNLVREGNTTTLSWEVSDATTCSLVGGGLDLQGLLIDGEQDTDEINQRTEFVLTCFNGDPLEGAPLTAQTEVVNIVPSYEEL